MTEVWVEVTADSIRGDRDGLIELRSAINDALKTRADISGVTYFFEDEKGEEHLVSIQRVGP